MKLDEKSKKSPLTASTISKIEETIDELMKQYKMNTKKRKVKQHVDNCENTSNKATNEAIDELNLQIERPKLEKRALSNSTKTNLTFDENSTKKENKNTKKSIIEAKLKPVDEYETLLNESTTETSNKNKKIKKNTLDNLPTPYKQTKQAFHQMTEKRRSTRLVLSKFNHNTSKTKDKNLLMPIVQKKQKKNPTFSLFNSDLVNVSNHKNEFEKISDSQVLTENPVKLERTDEIFISKHLSNDDERYYVQTKDEELDEYKHLEETIKTEFVEYNFKPFKRELKTNVDQ